jgi:hypothetical protein
MRKLLLTLSAAATAAAPAVAVASDTTPADQQNAAKLCKQIRSAAGTAADFSSTVQALYVGRKTKVTTKNAFGKCVSFYARDEARERGHADATASKQCKAEEAAATTPETHAAFASKYGAKNFKSAHGKCVRQKAHENKAKADQRDEQRVNAARTCRAEQKGDKDAFAQHYGTKRNAFGKCVSAHAKAKHS